MGARRLQILVSLRLFGTESNYIFSFRYRLGLCIKELIRLIFPTSSPFTFIWESMPGITHNYRNINSDDFGGHLVLRLENQERNIRTKDRHVTGLEIAKIVYHLF